MSELAPQVKEGMMKNSSGPGGTLWTDTVNKVFYASGGYFTDEAPTNFVIWSYNTVRGLWDVVETKGQPEYLAYGASAVAQDSGLGGFQINLTDNWSAGGPQYSSNHITFDAISRTYTNSAGIGDKGRGEGLMVFIPISRSSLLVYFGGITQDRGTGQISGVRLSDEP